MRILFVFLMLIFIQAYASSVILVVDKAGIHDNSFNSIAYEGLRAARDSFGISVSVIEATPGKESLSFAAALNSHPDLIIAAGHPLKTSLEQAALKNPEQKFALIDSWSELKNVTPVMFRNNEGSFLCGYLAAAMSKSGIIGFVGGQKNPIIENFLDGYTKGARMFNQSISVRPVYIGTTSDAWINPVKAYQLTTSLCGQGADVVFHAAGNSGYGVIKAAADNKIFAIGADKNQDSVAPGTVLTSMLKRVDMAVFKLIQDSTRNSLKQNYSFGIRELGVNLTNFQYTAGIIPLQIRLDLTLLKTRIASGKMKVSE